jgi:hypothetical protein
LIFGADSKVLYFEIQNGHIQQALIYDGNSLKFWIWMKSVQQLRL